MPLININTGEDFVPYIKMNAKAGRWYAKFNGYETEIEIQNPRLAFDFSNIKTGWIAFLQSGPPQHQWDEIAGQEGPKPDWAKVRRGFCVMVVGRDSIPNAGNQKLGARELMATSNSLIKPINAMFDAYDAETGHEGELPIYRCTGMVPVTGQNGTNYEPQFQLTGWKARGDLSELDGAEPSGGNDSPPTGQQQPEEPYLDDDIPF